MRSQQKAVLGGYLDAGPRNREYIGQLCSVPQARLHFLPVALTDAERYLGLRGQTVWVWSPTLLLPGPEVCSKVICALCLSFLLLHMTVWGLNRSTLPEVSPEHQWPLLVNGGLSILARWPINRTELLRWVVSIQLQGGRQGLCCVSWGWHVLKSEKLDKQDNSPGFWSLRLARGHGSNLSSQGSEASMPVAFR